MRYVYQLLVSLMFSMRRAVHVNHDKRYEQRESHHRYYDHHVDDTPQELHYRYIEVCVV